MCLAVPGKLVETFHDDDIAMRRGKVDFGGIRKEVCLSFTPEAVVGSYVLVHAGFSLTVIDEEEAERIFQSLSEQDLKELR
jgi:hydrogenase expression/formation protein HypC